jgi:predicted transcriptional regulator
MAVTVSERGAHRKELDERRARFKSALALARMTAKQWAEENGVTETHLYAVLKGDRESAKLLAKIDACIAHEFKKAAR